MKIGENDGKYLDYGHLSLSGSSIVIEKITDVLNIKWIIIWTPITWKFVLHINLGQD